MAEPLQPPRQSNGYRIMLVFEVDGADAQEADEKMRKLDAAAKRLGIKESIVDNAGPIFLRDDGRSR